MRDLVRLTPLPSTGLKKTLMKYLITPENLILRGYGIKRAKRNG
jgi:hypothetical protein